MTDVADLRADVNRRVADMFAGIDDYQEHAFIAGIDALAAELPDEDPYGLFHRACARDSWGHSDQDGNRGHVQAPAALQPLDGQLRQSSP
jgi:hypothetical protein